MTCCIFFFLFFFFGSTPFCFLVIGVKCRGFAVSLPNVPLFFFLVLLNPQKKPLIFPKPSNRIMVSTLSLIYVSLRYSEFPSC